MLSKLPYSYRLFKTKLIKFPCSEGLTVDNESMPVSKTPSGTEHKSRVRLDNDVIGGWTWRHQQVADWVGGHLLATRRRDAWRLQLISAIRFLSASAVSDTTRLIKSSQILHRLSIKTTCQFIFDCSSRVSLSIF